MFVALCKQTRDAACASWLNFISAILYIQIRWHFPQGLLRSAQAHRARHKFVLMRHNKLCFFYCQTLSGSISNHWGAAQLVSSSALWACEAALCAFHTKGETAAGLLIQVFLGWSSWSAAGRAALLSLTQVLTIARPSQFLSSRSESREFLQANWNSCNWSD